MAQTYLGTRDSANLKRANSLDSVSWSDDYGQPAVSSFESTVYRREYDKNSKRSLKSQTDDWETTYKAQIYELNRHQLHITEAAGHIGVGKPNEKLERMSMKSADETDRRNCPTSDNEPNIIKTSEFRIRNAVGQS